MRLGRLGDGHESAQSAVETAKALVNEVGAKSVHPVTKKVSQVKIHNANRDLFRFIRLPLDVSWVTCPVRSRPGSADIIESRLPMYDPHEYLDYLWSTGRFKVDESKVQTLSWRRQQFLFTG